ncbi:MAG TPA: amidohydrolase [Terriglobales bacterium]|nr:amidohydrolase [Terriglobales bacterium]
MNVRALLLLLFPICMVRAQEPAPPRADTIFIHGNIYTGIVDKAAFNAVKRAQAIAVRGERIQAVGENAEILKLKGPSTLVIDLGGKFAMPGFNDAHAHLSQGGFQALNVNLVGTKSLDDFRERIRANVAQAAPGAWILGGGWDENFWPVKVVPTRWDIDEVSAGHPVFLDRVDGHIAVANTRALQLASITIASRDPKGGKIDRDSNGQPTGILRETARQAITDAIPAPTHDERRAAMERALAEAARWGVTSVQVNSGDWDNFRVLEEIEKEGKLTARVTEWLPFDDSVDQLNTKRKAHPASDPMLHTGMLKGFMDGSLGSHTAALIEPYADDPKNSGLPRYDAPKLNEMTKERVLAGFQVGFHAIGDKGVQMALDAFAEAEKAAKEKKVKAANGGEDYRLRIEHAQVVTPLQVVKFRDLKVIASMQPCHLLTDMKWAQARLGENRAAHSYAWAEFLKRGATLAFGTDYPVESISPIRGLYSATTRKSEDGKQEYFPEQKISMDQAIAAYTTGSAFAEFEEKQKGLIVAGMFADFVVLDRDVTAMVPQKLLDTHVLRTVVAGKTVYEAK